MAIYACGTCPYEYNEEYGDPKQNIPAHTKFDDLPEDYVCPICGVGKDDFTKIG